MLMEEARYRFHPCRQLRSLLQKIFSIQPADEVVNPIAYKRTEEAGQHGSRKLKWPMGYKRRSYQDGSFTFQKSAGHQCQVSILLQKILHRKPRSKNFDIKMNQLLKYSFSIPLIL